MTNREPMHRRPKGWEYDKLSRWGRKLIHRKRRRDRRRALDKLTAK